MFRLFLMPKLSSRFHEFFRPSQKTSNLEKYADIISYCPFGFQSAIQPMERLPKLVDLLQFLLHCTSINVVCDCNQNFSQEWQRHVSRVIWGQHTTVSIKTHNFAFNNYYYILPYP